MRIPPANINAIRRDATVPTTVVVVTQVAAAPQANTPATSTSMETIAPTITVLKTITAGAVSGTTITLAISKIQNPLPLGLVSSNGVTLSIATSSTTSVSVQSGTTGLPQTTPISLLLNTSLLSSTRLGLAIGIPIAVVSIFGLVVFMLIYLRKRMDPKPTETLAFKAKKPLAAKPPISEKHSISSVYLSSDMEQGYEPSHEKRQLPMAHEDTPKPTFLKRISRLMNVPESPLEFKSPLFLRRFNLLSNKYGPETSEPEEKELPKSPVSVNPYGNVAPVPKVAFEDPDVPAKQSGSDLTYMVIKPYARRLGDELTVCVGEKVSIVDQHSDGWATVKLAASGETGVIPLMCIRKFIK